MKLQLNVFLILNENFTFCKNCRRLMSISTSLIALLLLISCETINTNNIDFDIDNHLSMYRKFKTNEPTSYSYIYSHSGFYSDSVKVYVSDGMVDSLIALDTLCQSSILNKNRYLIDSFFVSIENSYNCDNGIDVAEKDFYTTAIECNYDDNNYFPVNWDFDYYNDPGIAVETICRFKIDNFTILKD